VIRAAAASLAVVLAGVLTVLAVDVLRVPGRVAMDDAGFYGAPLRQHELYGAVDFIPWSPAERVLGLGDDLAYRKTIWLFRRVQPGKVNIAGADQPLLEALRGKAVLEVADRARQDHDPRRRAQLLNLSGVFTFSRYSQFSAFDKERLLREAVGAFRNAVRLDPANADARANLELVLRAAKDARLPGDTPDAGSSRGQGTGIGRSGSGY
jgi:hypothetical protein